MESIHLKNLKKSRISLGLLKFSKNPYCTLCMNDSGACSFSEIKNCFSVLKSVLIHSNEQTVES